jgi:hypothetical protein
MRVIIIFALALFTALLPAGLDAGSILSSLGQGEMVHEADARLRAMGGTGIALTEGYSGSLLNPALLGGLKQAGMTLTHRPEALYVKDTENNNVLTSARIVDFALCLPLGRGFAMAADLRQLSDFKFKAYQETTYFDQNCTGIISRTGGLSLASVNLAKIFGSSLYMGLQAGYVFGRTTQSRTDDFLDDDIRDTEVFHNFKNTGVRLSAGLALKLNQHFTTGLLVIPAYDVKQTEELTSSFEAPFTGKRTLTYPLKYGFGVTYRSGDNFLGQADVLITRWSDFQIDGRSVPGYQDIVRFAFGGQYRAIKKGSTSYVRRIPLRLGYALEPWYQKTASGQTITGHFFTLGFGLPFGRRGGALDVSLELGFRGDVSSIGTEETIVRGHISFWGFEPWFQRRK